MRCYALQAGGLTRNLLISPRTPLAPGTLEIYNLNTKLYHNIVARTRYGSVGISKSSTCEYCSYEYMELWRWEIMKIGARKRSQAHVLSSDFLGCVWLRDSQDTDVPWRPLASLQFWGITGDNTGIVMSQSLTLNQTTLFEGSFDPVPSCHCNQTYFSVVMILHLVSDGPNILGVREKVSNRGLSNYF
jgi:hypothetical protein